ncbi:GTP cyclohydrolase II [Hasllibacter halocynthiae]|uniref:GTP cyclohydrolase-2 n=1 Tax=Hasllibacter halocynthiae TaxID=595589 RepID=A0A2T0X1F5_9RHOB|nr:GTP cyclohydrolase II [Hasllibacter halocynthiae]PRY92778.1 GTP cyclohydrolase II [Hasllibacter halocynthiae]
MDALTPTLPERIARARADLRAGVPVALDGWLALPVETAPDDRLRALAGMEGARLVLTRRRAEGLRLPVYDGELTRVAAGGMAPAALRAAADPSRDLAAPLKGPFEPVRGDPGPAEAAVALAKSAQLLPAMLLARGGAPGLTALPAAEVLRALRALPPLPPVIAARVPLALAERARVHVHRPLPFGPEHYAVEIGDALRRAGMGEAPLVRLHSACFTGDVLGSLKCDCGPQLAAALAAMGEAGAGVLLYLNQEGRGIGLANKMRAYALQDQGFDTVEANHRLGFEDDERDFRLGAAMLRHLGVPRVRLMTNNPRKVERLAAEGIEVAERLPLIVGANPRNEEYLRVKALKSGHVL